MSTTKRAGTDRIAGHTFDRAAIPLLATLGLGVFAGALDLGVLSPALTALADEFAIAPRDLAWVFTLYLLANVVAIPIMTKLSDVHGRRSVYVVCVAIFAGGSLLAILAPNFWLFLVARAIQAIGAGGIFPVAAAAIGDRVPLERRGAALGMLGAVWGLAAIVGPALGGVVTHAFTWRYIFLANIPLAVVVIVFAQRYVPAIAAKKRGPLDLAGIVTLSIGLLAVMIALTRLDTRAAVTSNAVTAAAFAVAGIAFAALVAIERRAGEPVIAPALFATRQLVATYALEVAIGILEGALFFIPAALIAARHLTYATAGAIATIGALTFVAVIPFAGRALDRFGSRNVLFAGALTTAGGLALFGWWLPNLLISVPAIVLAGVGFGALLGAPTRYIITTDAPATMRATALGLLSVFLIIGQILGGSLAGGVIGTNIREVGGYRLAYELFAAIGLIAMGFTLLLKTKAAERR